MAEEREPSGLRRRLARLENEGKREEAGCWSVGCLFVFVLQGVGWAAGTAAAALLGKSRSDWSWTPLLLPLGLTLFFLWRAKRRR